MKLHFRTMVLAAALLFPEALAAQTETSWYGFVAPAGTPDQIIRKPHDQIARIVNMPDINEPLSSQGADPVGSSPEEFGQYMRNETAKWAKVVKASGTRLD